MKIERGFGSIRRFAVFSNPFVRYGRRMVYSFQVGREGWIKDRYTIQLRLPFTPVNINIYRGLKKPAFRDINLIAAIWLCLMPFCFVALCVACLPKVLGCFYYETLYKETFITGWVERLSGFISFVLSLIGLATLIQLL